MRLELKKIFSLLCGQVHDLTPQLSVLPFSKKFIFIHGGNTAEVDICRQRKEITCPTCLSKSTTIYFDPRRWLLFPLHCDACLKSPFTEMRMIRTMNLPEDYDTQALLLASQHMQALAIKTSVYCQATLEKAEATKDTANLLNATKDLFIASSIGFAKHKQMVEKQKMDQKMLGAKTPELLTMAEPAKENISLLQASTLKVIA